MYFHKCGECDKEFFIHELKVDDDGKMQMTYYYASMPFCPNCNGVMAKFKREVKGVSRIEFSIGESQWLNFGEG